MPLLNRFSPGGKLSSEQVGGYYADLVLSMLRADGPRNETEIDDTETVLLSTPAR